MCSLLLTGEPRGRMTLVWYPQPVKDVSGDAVFYFHVWYNSADISQGPYRHLIAAQPRRGCVIMHTLDQRATTL